MEKIYLTNLKKPLFGIEKQVKETIDKYNLIKRGEKVIVALSGGKDSTSLLYILKKLGYNVSGLMIDLNLGNWSEIHKKNMTFFCRELGIKLNIVDLKKEFGHGICFIKRVVKEKKNLSGCTVCGVIKRWILNKEAKKLKADKIATGHNLDDECQTVLMNFLKGNIYLGMNSSPATGIEFRKSDKREKDSFNFNLSPPPKNDFINNKQINYNINSAKHKTAESKGNRKFSQRIKPFFFTAENKIREYAKKMQFPILYDRCPCAIGTYRVETRAWLSNINDKNKLNIVNQFQKIIPKLREKRGLGVANKCKICGEPARKETCNACEMFVCLGR